MPMRIGMVVPSLGFAGGIEKHAWDLARALRSRGHTLRLIYRDNGAFDTEAYRAGFDSVEPASTPRCAADLDVAYVLRVSHPDELKVLGDMPLVLGAHDHVNTCPRTSRYLPVTLRPCHRPPGLACLTYGCCLVRDRRYRLPASLRLRNPFVYPQRVTALAARAPFLACSAYVGTNLIRAGADPGRVHVIHPLPPEDPNPLVSRPETRRLLVVAHLLRGKGVDLAIRALAKLPSDCELEVVGEGPSRRSLAALAAKTAPGRVNFTGYIAPEKVWELYDRASVVLVPARWPEPFGMTGIEAMRRGRPVVAAAHGGIPEWLAHGNNGLLFSPGSVESLASAVNVLLGDATAGERARRYAERRFRYEEHVDRVEAFLQSTARLEY